MIALQEEILEDPEAARKLLETIARIRKKDSLIYDPTAKLQPDESEEEREDAEAAPVPKAKKHKAIRLAEINLREVCLLPASPSFPLLLLRQCCTMEHYLGIFLTQSNIANHQQYGFGVSSMQAMIREPIEFKSNGQSERLNMHIATPSLLLRQFLLVHH